MTSDQAITLFYLGNPMNVSRHWATFDNIIQFDDAQMEACHDYIQWLFPIPEQSMWNPNSPVLSPERAELFRVNDFDRLQVQRAFERWMAFMSGTAHWVRLSDHNHLRITRVIRFLILTGFPKEAHQVYDKAVEMMNARSCLMPRTHQFWVEALTS